MYPDHIVLPMKQELTNNGFTELKNDDNIKDLIQNDSSLIVVNSVCGCAAANARPGVLKSLKNRDLNSKLVRRRGRVYIINKKNPKFKARQK